VDAEAHSNSKQRDSIRFAGRDWPVLDRLRIGRQSYLILEKTGVGPRQRYMAFDPHAGPGGDLRAILLLPHSRPARQHLRILKRISAGNDNLPTILHYRAQGDRLLVVLAWVRGPDLRSYLDQVRTGKAARPSPTEAFRLYRGLAHGLSHLARRHAIVHGDVKPANTILTRGPSRLVLIDFGSAWQLAGTVTRSEGDGTSPVYAAPELQAGARIGDFRADQFSATAMLYELLTLKVPYEGLGGQAGRPAYAERMHHALVLPSSACRKRPRLPNALWQGLDRICQCGLALDRERRYATTSAWLDAVNRLYGSMQPHETLSPTHQRLTRVVGRLARHFHRIWPGR